MNRILKSLSVLSLLLLMSLTLTGIASADVIKGIGWIHAEGAGTARLQMSGNIDIEGHGVGAVYIYGAETMRAEGQGKRIDLPGGGVLYRGFQGKIEATGSKMNIRIIGGKIDFTAHGKGRVALRGRGTYQTGNGGSGDWQPDGLTLEVVEE